MNLLLMLIISVHLNIVTPDADFAAETLLKGILIGSRFNLSSSFDNKITDKSPVENEIIEEKGDEDQEEEDYEDNIIEVDEPSPPTEHPNNIEDIYQNFELKKVEARTSENFTQLTFQEMVTIYHDIWNTMLVWEPHQPPAPVPEDRSMIVKTEDNQKLRHVLSSECCS